MDTKKFDEIKAKVESSVMMKLEQIRRFLREGKATVMVGSGFSKNAIMDDGVEMLDWPELCVRFYKELYGKEPEEKDLRLKSALKLAQQIESVKGRNALEELIKDSLPNDSIYPGYLHELLVSLNWRDIFTTNYDTLLEDAAYNAFKHYNVVTSKHSLIYQPHPRIVKVHGSFPDYRPFIITEEDYRTYETLFPEFVNTVRQALIETQFVLVGFSGDDPNFLNWLGWFRDIMGSRMLPVYLISAGDMPHISEAQLMEKRGVQLIPTSSCTSNIPEALDFILSYIGDKHTSRNSWSGRLSQYQFSKDLSLVELTNEMKLIRDSYPRWIILPVDKISEFCDTWETFPFYGNKFNELTDDEKIDFLKELDWRLTVSFMPKWIDDEWYIKALEWAESIYDSVENDKRDTIISLSLSLLQIYRQRDDSRYAELQKKLDKRINPSDHSKIRKLLYESAIWFLQHNEIEKCAEKIDSWEVSADDYRGVLWKSRLLLELGENKRAIILLEQSLEKVRRRLLSNHPTSLHISAFSVLEDCLKIAKQERLENNNSKFPLFIKYRDFALDEMSNDNGGGFQRVHGFNIDNSTSRWSSGGSGYILKYVGAARYFQMAEDYGRPIGLSRGSFNEDVAKKALPLLASISIRSALLYLVEANSTTALEMSLSRQNIMGIGDISLANELFDEWSKSLLAHDQSKDSIPSPKVMNVIIPLLSRLCVYATTERITDFINRLNDLHGLTNHDLHKYLATAYNSLPLEQCEMLWWQLMSKPIKLDFREKDYCMPGAIIDRWKGNQNIVDIIIVALNSDNRDILNAGIDRLMCLYHLLPEDNIREIDNLIESRWDFIKDSSLSHFFGLNIDDIEDKPWGKLLLDYLHKEVDKFMTETTSEVSSSVPISHFGDKLALFTNCHRYLDKNQIEGILSHIIHFISNNQESINKNDSESFFGGMRHFWKDALIMVNYFLSKVDTAMLNVETATEILQQMQYLRMEYPFSSALVSTIVSDGKILNTGKSEERSKIRQFITDGIRSGDKSLITDAFKAAEICHSKTDGKFGLQTIVDEVVNRIHYLHDQITVWYLKSLLSWAKSDVVLETRMKRMAKYLKEMPDTVLKNESLSFDIKADLLYYAGKLVGYISKFASEYEDIEKCLSTWNGFISSSVIPHDICKGFYIGKVLATMNKNTDM